MNAAEAAAGHGIAIDFANLGFPGEYHLT